MSQETGCNETIAVTSVTITLFFFPNIMKTKFQKHCRTGKKIPNFYIAIPTLPFFVKLFERTTHSRGSNPLFFVGSGRVGGRGVQKFSKWAIFFLLVPSKIRKLSN